MSHKVRRKSKKVLDEEVINIAEHLAQTRLFEISNEAENQQQPIPANDSQPINRKYSPISRSIVVQSSDKRMRDTRFMIPLQSRTLTRRINVINYSHSSMPACRNYEIKDQKGNTMYVGTVKQQCWFEPAKNFSKEIECNVAKFIILDNRQTHPRSNDAISIPKVRKGLYKNSFFSKARSQRQAEGEDHMSVLQLPRSKEFIGNRYRSLKHVIHSIHNNFRNHSCDSIERRPNKKF